MGPTPRPPLQADPAGAPHHPLGLSKAGRALANCQTRSGCGVAGSQLMMFRDLRVRVVGLGLDLDERSENEGAVNRAAVVKRETVKGDIDEWLAAPRTAEREMRH